MKDEEWEDYYEQVKLRILYFLTQIALDVASRHLKYIIKTG